MDKRLKQIVTQVLKLRNTPRSLQMAKVLIDSYRMNFNFETMPKKSHWEYVDNLERLLDKFRAIRGR